MKDERLWSAVEALVSAINFRNVTPLHSVNVANYSVQIAQHLGWELTTVEEVRMGALLHDIGQIFFTDQMINDPNRPLTTDEKKLIKEHPLRGVELIKDFPSLDFAKPYILLHQENIDGSGYPFGLKNEEIPLQVQVVSIADVYEALRHSRYYLNRYGHTHNEAVEKMQLKRGVHWKEEIFDAFMDVSKKWSE